MRIHVGVHVRVRFLITLNAPIEAVTTAHEGEDAVKGSPFRGGEGGTPCLMAACEFGFIDAALFIE
jgi:hypothetical protein